jgi:hypothetical protein
MAQRRFGEPPNQTRTTTKRNSGRLTAAERKRRRERQQTESDVLGSIIRALPSAIASVVTDTAKTAFNPTPGWARAPKTEEERQRRKRETAEEGAWLAASAVPVVGPFARVGRTVAKTTGKAKAGTSTVTKTTKKVANKKNPPQKPQSQIAKQRKRDLEKIDEATGAKPKATPKETPPVKPREVVARGRRQNIAKMNKAKAQKDRGKYKTDAPEIRGTKQKPRPKKELPYKAEGPTNKTKSQVRQEKQNKGAAEREATRGPMTQEEILETLRPIGFKPKSTKSASDIVSARKPGATGKARKSSEKDEAASAKKSANEKRSQTKKETEDIKRRGDEYRTGTPMEKTVRDLQVSRLRRAGAERPTATDPKFAGRKKDGSQALAGIDIEDISGMSMTQLRSLRRQLEKRVRRGNAKEKDVQLLSEVRNSLDGSRFTNSLMRNGNQSKGRGQPDAAPGAVNPPRNVKASNQKWREEGGKDAPKGPRGKTGKAKRGDKITENTKAEDGVTRIKGKGGQKRRQVAPGQEVVPVGRRPGASGRRTGGSTSSGRRPIALGSGRRPANTPARGEVVQGEVVRGGRRSGSSAGGGRTQREPIDLKTRPRGGGSSGSGRSRPKAIGPGGAKAIESGKTAASKKKRSKKGLAGKIVGGGALAGAAAGGALYGIGQTGKGEEKEETPKPKARDRSTLRDKYGRKISREEYNKREAYRERIKSMTPAERKAARKKEMKRREQYRETEGKSRYGTDSSTITRNLDLREGVSSRMVNKKTRERFKKSKDKTRSGKQQARNEVREKYRRNKK